MRRAAWCAAAALALGSYACLLWWAGGFDLQIAGTRLRSHDSARPALLALAIAAAAAWLSKKRLRDTFAGTWPLVDTTAAARAMAVAALVWTAGASLTFSTGTAGGSDSFGYLSQARLFGVGRLTDTIPLVHHGLSPSILVPLGYRAGLAADWIAPTYPPGLPLVMAAFARLGEYAVHLVVPLFGLILVWGTLRLGIEIGDPLAGGLAAAALSVSPIFLFQVFQPMSDVPAAACWLSALLLASRGSMPGALAAGALTSLAVLIRPNLAPLGLLPLLGTVLAGRSGRVSRGCAFVAAGLPAAVALGWIQQIRYGSPVASGYGEAGSLYTWDSILPNLSRYPRWLTGSETPIIWLWLAAPIWIARVSRRRAAAWIALACVAGTWIAYLPYFAFAPHEWFYTRFLLPALPVMLVFAAAVCLWGIRRLPPAPRTALTIGGAVMLGGVLLSAAQARGVFSFHVDEQRYRSAGTYVRDRLPDRAVVLAGQHSGSVRYYSGRQTVRWDLMDAAALDDTLATLRRSGFVPFVVVDPEEDADFRRIFGAAHQEAVARLRPLAELGRARVYAID